MISLNEERKNVFNAFKHLYPLKIFFRQEFPASTEGGSCKEYFYHPNSKKNMNHLQNHNFFELIRDSVSLGSVITQDP